MEQQDDETERHGPENRNATEIVLGGRTLQGFVVVYLVGLLQVIPWCRYLGKMWPMVPRCCCGTPPMVYPVVAGYTKAAAWCTPRGIAGLL